MKILMTILTVLLLFLQYRLWFGPAGVRDVVQLKKTVAAQEAQNQALQARNQVVIAEIEDLKSGHEAIEEHARAELGMVKKNETFYQIVRSAGQTS